MYKIHVHYHEKEFNHPAVYECKSYAFQGSFFVMRGVVNHYSRNGSGFLNRIAISGNVTIVIDDSAVRTDNVP